MALTVSGKHPGNTLNNPRPTQGSTRKTSPEWCCEDIGVNFRKQGAERKQGAKRKQGRKVEHLNHLSHLPPPPVGYRLVAPTPIAIKLHPTERLTRERSGAILGGVAQGLASWLAIDVVLVRVALVIAASSAGIGVIAYVALWLRLPLESGTERGSGVDQQKPSMDIVSALSTAAISLGLALASRRIGLALPARILWPLLIGAVGIAMVWPRVSDQLGAPDRARLLEEGPRALSRTAADFVSSPQTTIPRVIVGGVLVLTGVSAFAVGDPSSDAVRSTIIALIIMALGSACILGPWLVRLTNELSVERVNRAKAQAREEFAAHLHDSVLQTLAIIQRRSDDPRQVVAIARRQERELRAWLYDGTSTLGDVDYLGTALELTAQEVEGDHGVTIDVVMVGDIMIDDRISALVAAAREAMVNAAKHSGQKHIDVFAECTPKAIEVFVRDRGVGFDQLLVSADRRGIAQSICARMERIGGTGKVHSTIGDGTEVELVVPLEPLKEDQHA